MSQDSVQNPYNVTQEELDRPEDELAYVDTSHQVGEYFVVSAQWILTKAPTTTACSRQE